MGVRSLSRWCTRKVKDINVARVGDGCCQDKAAGSVVPVGTMTHHQRPCRTISGMLPRWTRRRNETNQQKDGGICLRSGRHQQSGRSYRANRALAWNQPAGCALFAGYAAV